MRNAKGAGVRVTLGATLIAMSAHSIAADIGSNTNGLDTGSAQGIDAASIHGIDAASRQGIDAASIHGIDAASGQGIDAASILGIDAASGQGIDAASNLGIDAASIHGIDAASGQGIDAASIHGIDAASGQGIDAASVGGIDAASNLGIDAASSHGIDAASIHGIDAASGQGIDAASILGIDAASILGIDAASSHGIDAASRQGIDAASSFGVASDTSVMLSGPVNSIDRLNGVFESMGQIVMASQDALSRMQIGDYVSVEGTAIASGWMYADGVSISDQRYVPGSTEVFVSGILSSIDQSNGTAQMGGLTIDYTPSLGSSDAPSGAMWSFRGTRPGASGVMVSDWSASTR